MHTCRIKFLSINCKVMKRFYTLDYYKMLDHLETDIEILYYYKELLESYGSLKLKVGQKLYTSNLV